MVKSPPSPYGKRAPTCWDSTGDVSKFLYGIKQLGDQPISGTEMERNLASKNNEDIKPSLVGGLEH